MVAICPLCGTHLSTNDHLKRHLKVHERAHHKKCFWCNYTSARPDNLKRHINRLHKTNDLQGVVSNTVKSMVGSPVVKRPKKENLPPLVDLTLDDDEQSSSISESLQVDRTLNDSTEGLPASTVELIEDPVEFDMDDDRVAAQEAPEPMNSSDSAEWKPEDSYEMTKINEFWSKKWATTNANYEIKIKGLPSSGWQEMLLQILEEILHKIRSKAKPGSMGRIVVYIDGLQYPINDRVTNLEKLDINSLLDKIAKALNSNEEADITKGLKLNIIFTEMPQGGTGARAKGRPGAYATRTIADDDDYDFQKRSLLNPAGFSKDNLCMSRCLVVAMAMVNHETLKDVNGSPVNFKYLCDWRKPLQKSRALQLHEDAGVPSCQKGGIPELEMFQQHLQDYQIVLYGHNTQLLWKGPVYKDMQLYLRLRGDHYRVINPKLLRGFFAKSFHCKKCQETWDHGLQHNCSEATCTMCTNPDCKNKAVVKRERICDDCNRTFPSTDCFMVHKVTECGEIAICPNCLGLQKRSKLDPPSFKPDITQPQPQSNHNCLQNFCRFCNQHYMPGFHTHCHVQKPREKKTGNDEPLDENAEEGIFDLYGERQFEEGYEDRDVPEDGACHEGKAERGRQATEQQKKFVFGDFETETREALHDPILLCLKENNGKRHKYKGANCAKNFVEDCFTKKPKKRKRRRNEEQEDQEAEPTRKKYKEFQDTTFIFHNFSGFDCYPILHEIYKKKLKPRAIFRQSKLLTLRLQQNRQRFIDSFLHMPMALEAMPKAYGFPAMQKGFFPYTLLTKENRKYKGAFPPLEAFDPGNMTPKKRAELIAWHAEEQTRYDADPELVYDLQAEMVKYCINDVDILEQGVEAYRKRMADLFDGLDPMDHITLPSFCNFAFRKIMMKPNTIGIIPPRGYGTVKQSKTAIAWLEWMVKELGLPILHARNSNEVKIGKYRTDGLTFSRSGAPAVLESYGCYFHGHKCQTDREKTCGGRTMDELHEDTVKREEFLKRAGYQLITTYECEMVDEMLDRDDDEEMLNFITELKERLSKSTPLNPRDALHGGRTNAIRIYYEPKSGEFILYYDIQSLYPSVNYSTQGELWPIGHPKIYLHSFMPIEEVFGLIKGTFKPPERLFHPVLGVLENNKFVFGLCGTCMASGATTHCTHTGEERYITGTFVSEELKVALEKGYEVVSVSEIWHWPEEQRSETLFREFIARAYREKIEASGWPVEIERLLENGGMDDPEVQQHIQSYVDQFAALGIQIRPDFVEKNPARRAAAKLVLNNFWGFWAKTNNPDQTTYLDNLADFYRLLTTKDVGSYYPANDDIMVVHWKEKEQLEKADGKSNVVLAAFTTAYARLRLGRFLDTVGDRCLYMDTDSVVWIDRPGEPKIETGDQLGDMKDEILDEFGPNATIGAYGAAGPKTYSLMICDKDTKEVIHHKRRMKGIKTTFNVDEKLPAAKLLDLIKKEYSIKVPQRILRRNKTTATMQWKEIEKVVRSTFSKRLLPANLSHPTDPIGSKAWAVVPYVKPLCFS